MQALDHPGLWKLITTFGKFHSAKELFMFMLTHFLPTLFDNTRHKVTFLGEIVSATVVRTVLSAYLTNSPSCRLTTYHGAKKGVKVSNDSIPGPSHHNHQLFINSLDPLRHSSSL
jgi:hypothetical protein